MSMSIGGCLDQLLHDFGSFGENVICNYSKQITRGIVFLHESGIIHRDLKGKEIEGGKCYCSGGSGTAVGEVVLGL